MNSHRTSNKLNEEQQKHQIELFYRYLKLSATSLLIYSKKTKTYSSEYLTFVPNNDSFISQTLKNNKKGCCFACRNRFHTKRVTKNITFLKKFIIDIDDDFDNSKSKKFEELCKKYNITIEAKAESREKGGYHYYIPFKPTYITDENREDIIKISRNFRQFLLDNNIDIDKRIFDLPRLIRIWGTYNHKRESFCRLIYLHTAKDEQIETNTQFLTGLESKKFPDLPTVSSFISSCKLIEYIRHHKLKKEDTEKNDKLLKNVAIFLFTLLGDAGFKIGEEITLLQSHNPSEFKGWFEKAKSGELKHFGCGELNIWLNKYYPELLSQTCSKCRLLNRNKVEYLESNESFHQLKKQARERQKLLINKEVFIQGIVAPTINQYKQEVIIFKIFEKESDDAIPPQQIIFFDEKSPRSSSWREVGSFCVDFYAYELVEDGISYLLLSEKKMDFGEYFIEGSAVKLTDQLLIGNYGKIGSRRKIILLNKARSLIDKIKDIDELFRRIINLKKEDFLDYIFSQKDEEEKTTYIFRQPENINVLITAFLFSAKFEYPLHLCLYGKQDSGKTSIISCIFSKFNESYNNLIDGANTTLKGVVPSFAHAMPKIGVILESRRICAIDEFFRIIKGDEDRDRLSVLNNILLHQKYTNRTGKGTLDIKMQSKLLTVTNPLYGCDFKETIEKLPPSTLDRMLIWKQYKSHYNWVRQGQEKVEKEVKFDKYLFLSIYDFLNSFKSKFEKLKLMEIVEEIKSKVPNYTLDLYDSRWGRHHSLCLMDGIIKFRCLCERDKTFTANEKDFATFRSLWEDLVIGWWDNVLPDEEERLLSDEQKAMMELIKQNKEIWDYRLEKLCEEKNISYKHNYKRLLDLKLIEVNNRKISIVEQMELNFEDV